MNDSPVKPRRRHVWIAAVVLVLAAVAVFVLLPRDTQVQTITLQREDAVRTLAVNGRIRPRLSVEVQAPVAGTLLELPFDIGDRIRAGEMLARVDDGPQRAAIAEAGAAIEAQEAALAQARRDLARFEALGEFVTRRQVEEARLAVEQGASELERRRADRREAREVQQRYVVRAPFAGVILDRPVDPGQTVSPETVLYRLADLTAPEISAEVDEDYAVELRTGTIGLVEMAGSPQPLRAEIMHIEPRVDETTGAREVRLRLLGLPGPAPAGQTVSVNLVVERHPGAISVPRESILQPDTDPRVRVIDEHGRVAERPVRFIDWPAAEVVVTAGLEPGTKVLRNPAAAAPGSRVRPAD